jgi:FlaA1/EpsC-like NDP-sugar epimerase
MFNGKRILITGATGSWGNTLVRRLLSDYNPKKIVCFSRGELQQVLMKRKFADPRVQMVIGDVRDYDAVEFATRDIDIVFHLAALKHVPICEEHPQEAIKTNIIGTTNIVNASIVNKVSKVIDVSTDKAVAPSNLYGMTKAVGEKVILQANDLSEHTRFVCVRGGNVMGSNGSVIPYFIEQIKNGGPVTITDSRMTRFFLTLDEAISLLFKATEESIGGETLVMKMPACHIQAIIKVLMEEYGEVPITQIGIRDGEKLHEVLVSTDEAPHTYEYKNDYYVILPRNSNTQLKEKYLNNPKFMHDQFDSQTFWMSHNDVKTMLKNGGFI